MATYEGDLLNNGYCEYLTPVKASGRAVAARLGIVLGTMLLVGVMLALTLSTIPTISFTLLALFVFLAWFVWQFTKVEYEYVVATGELTLTKIYGARMRKKVLTFSMQSIVTIAPLAEFEKVRDSVKSVHFACNKNDAYGMCLVYTTKGGEKQMLVISAPDRTVKTLKHYRKNAFLVK